MHVKNILTTGRSFREAQKALIMIHGRGGTADDILSLAPLLPLKEFALVAPQAENHSWYPYSFLEKPTHNEPWLSSALDLLSNTVRDIRQQGIEESDIYFLGFSQGACLTLEFTTRHARSWGGVVALTGGLIGDRIYRESYSGDFGQTPILVTSGDPDPHIPVERAKASVSILEELHARVTLKIYPNRPHTISREELQLAESLIFKESQASGQAS